MIRVCDSIMGSGKSSACINYINERPDQRFIYITPYLDEATRIKHGCRKMNFYEPSKFSGGEYHSKTRDTVNHIKAGHNIASTHEAFGYYTPDMIDLIKSGHYTLLIDESVNVLMTEKITPGDVELLVKSGCINGGNGSYTIGETEYTGTVFKPFMRRLISRNFFHVDGDQYQHDYFFWMLPKEFMLAFDDVIVMTYIFHGHDMYLFMKMNGIEFSYMGVQRREDGYHFVNYPSAFPEYTKHLKDIIHIFDNDKLNGIGDTRCALSMSWFNNRDDRQQLKRNITQYFRYYMSDFSADERLFGTYKNHIEHIGSRGYTNAGLVFNARATNEYANRHVLVYAANVFYDGGRRKFFKDNGFDVNEDLYALSTMVQWIWRSGIRNGEEIWIYIPSRRMRELLQGWLDRLERGEAA